MTASVGLCDSELLRVRVGDYALGGARARAMEKVQLGSGEHRDNIGAPIGTAVAIG